MKKCNPRNRPATQADVERARRDGMSEATSSSIAIFFTVLLDKRGWTAEMLQELWRDIDKLSVEIAEKRVKVPDLMRVLKEEYDITIQ